MPKYRVYQQLYPATGEAPGEWIARLEPVGEVEVKDERAAIAVARTMPVFLRAQRKTLARHPIVEEMGAPRRVSEPRRDEGESGC